MRIIKNRQNISRRLLVVAGIFLLGLKCMAATHYVVPPGTAGVTPADPFTNWATAGTNLIDVVNAAMTNTAARLVWVTNGTYSMTNQIYVNNALTLQSVNGRDATILNGQARLYTNSCVDFDVASCVFDGFTVSNYYSSDSAVYMNRGTLRNCLIIGNTNTGGSGGTVQLYKGTAATNCIFKNNRVNSQGGGIYSSGGSSLMVAGCLFEGNDVGANYGGACSLGGSGITISNCVFINNIAPTFGGGIYLSGADNKVVNCTITGNMTTAASSKGGGIFCTGPITIKNCSIIGNSATNQGGGVWGTNITIQNCLIAQNQSTTNAGGGIWMTNGIIESCTIAANYAKVVGGGIYITGSDSRGTNNIVYFNTAADGANFTNDTVGATGLNYSCVIPAVDGTGNITNNPVFKNQAGGDYHLRMTSPCVNAGTNQFWMTNAVDLDGNARILKIIVDMGAYETRIWQGTIFSAYGR